MYISIRCQDLLFSFIKTSFSPLSRPPFLLYQDLLPSLSALLTSAALDFSHHSDMVPKFSFDAHYLSVQFVYPRFLPRTAEPLSNPVPCSNLQVELTDLPYDCVLKRRYPIRTVIFFSFSLSAPFTSAWPSSSHHNDIGFFPCT